MLSAILFGVVFMNVTFLFWNFLVIVLAFYVTEADDKLIEDFKKALPWFADLLAGIV